MIKKVYTAKEVCRVLGMDPETFESCAAGVGRYVIDAHAQLTLPFETVRNIPLDALSYQIKQELARNLAQIVPDVWQFTLSDRPEIDAHIITADVAFLHSAPHPATSAETAALIEKTARHIKAFQYVNEGLIHE